MAKERPNKPHPRAANSMRMSAEEFRAKMGRSSKPRHGYRPTLKSLAAKGDQKGSECLEFTLPFLPPSVNAIYSTVTDRVTGKTKRILSAKARKARKAIQTFVRGTLSVDQIYELHINVELPALTKAGNLKKIDLSNRVKFLEDCLASGLGIDDRQFFRIVLTKLHAEHERTIVRVQPFGYQAQDAA